MTDCTNCRGTFDPDTSTSQDPERFCDSRCEDQHLGDVDPNDLGTFGEYLDAYTARGGMTDDERTAFWMRWTKETIVWVFVAVGALIVKGAYSGVVDVVASAIGAVSVVVLIGQVVHALRFGRERRRWQR